MDHSNGKEPNWTSTLEDEDLSFLKRFVLASGSLKDLAADYDISYPTVRLRLDRLIEKIKIHESQKIASEFEKTARSLYADGKIDMATLKTILAAYQKDKKKESKA